MLRCLFVCGFEKRGRRDREEGEREADFLVDCTFIRDIFRLKIGLFNLWRSSILNIKLNTLLELLGKKKKKENLPIVFQFTKKKKRKMEWFNLDEKNDSK